MGISIFRKRVLAAFIKWRGSYKSLFSKKHKNISPAEHICGMQEFLFGVTKVFKMLLNNMQPKYINYSFKEMMNIIPTQK